MTDKIEEKKDVPWAETISDEKFLEYYGIDRRKIDVTKCENWARNQSGYCANHFKTVEHKGERIRGHKKCAEVERCNFKGYKNYKTLYIQSQRDLKVAKEALEKSKRIIKSILDKSCYGKDKCKTDKCTSYSIFCSFYHLAEDLKELEQTLAQLNGGNDGR